MSSNLSRDPLSILRQTITALDNDPEPPTPQLIALRELLDNRLKRLEAEHRCQTAGPPLEGPQANRA